MEPLKVYDYLTRARHRMFDWVRTLAAQDYMRVLSPGQRTLAQTLTHIMLVEWANLRLVQGIMFPPYEQWPFQEEEPPPFAALEAAWIEQEGRAREVLGAIRDWDAEFEFRLNDDNGRAMLVNATSDEIFTHMVLHEVHHRGQAMSMLSRLGVAVEDIDFNTLMYRRRPADPAPAHTAERAGIVPGESTP